MDAETRYLENRTLLHEDHVRRTRLALVAMTIMLVAIVGSSVATTGVLWSIPSALIACVAVLGSAGKVLVAQDELDDHLRSFAKLTHRN